MTTETETKISGMKRTETDLFIEKNLAKKEISGQAARKTWAAMQHRLVEVVQDIVQQEVEGLKTRIELHEKFMQKLFQEHKEAADKRERKNMWILSLTITVVIAIMQLIGG